MQTKHIIKVAVSGRHVVHKITNYGINNKQDFIVPFQTDPNHDFQQDRN